MKKGERGKDIKKELSNNDGEPKGGERTKEQEEDADDRKNRLKVRLD